MTEFIYSMYSYTFEMCYSSAFLGDCLLLLFELFTSNQKITALWSAPELPQAEAAKLLPYLPSCMNGNCCSSAFMRLFVMKKASCHKSLRQLPVLYKGVLYSNKKICLHYYVRNLFLAAFSQNLFSGLTAAFIKPCCGQKFGTGEQFQHAKVF